MHTETGDANPEVPIIEVGGVARAVVWPGTGASLRSMHTIDLGPRGATVVFEPPHGGGVLRARRSRPRPRARFRRRIRVEPGSMVHVEPATRYRFEAGPEGMRIVGGPSPPDPRMVSAPLGEWFGRSRLESLCVRALRHTPRRPGQANGARS